MVLLYIYTLYIYTMEYHIQVLWIKFKKAVLPIISQPMTILSAPKKSSYRINGPTLSSPCDMQKAPH